MDLDDCDWLWSDNKMKLMGGYTQREVRDLFCQCCIHDRSHTGQRCTPKQNSKMSWMHLIRPYTTVIHVTSVLLYCQF